MGVKNNAAPKNKNLFRIFLDWFLRRPESGIILILAIFIDKYRRVILSGK